MNPSATWFIHLKALRHRWFSQVTLSLLVPWEEQTFTANLPREHKQKNSISSLHEKVLPLGDHVLVYPAHGAGSVCGHGISGHGTNYIGL